MGFSISPRQAKWLAGGGLGAIAGGLMMRKRKMQTPGAPAPAATPAAPVNLQDQHWIRNTQGSAFRVFKATGMSDSDALKKSGSWGGVYRASRLAGRGRIRSYFTANRTNPQVNYDNSY